MDLNNSRLNHIPLWAGEEWGEQGRGAKAALLLLLSTQPSNTSTLPALPWEQRGVPCPSSAAQCRGRGLWNILELQINLCLRWSRLGTIPCCSLICAGDLEKGALRMTQTLLLSPGLSCCASPAAKSLFWVPWLQVLKNLLKKIL